MGQKRRQGRGREAQASRGEEKPEPAQAEPVKGSRSRPPDSFLHQPAAARSYNIDLAASAAAQATSRPLSRSGVKAARADGVRR